MKLQKITYDDLKPKQQESYNFQKVSAILADYGFATIRLSDDWQGADFIAQHIDGQTFLKVQLKGRLYFAKEYQNKTLWIAFRYDGQWYLYPHDDLLNELSSAGYITGTDVWKDEGVYHFPRISADILKRIEKHKM